MRRCGVPPRAAADRVLAAGGCRAALRRAWPGRAGGPVSAYRPIDLKPLQIDSVIETHDFSFRALAGQIDQVPPVKVRNGDDKFCFVDFPRIE